MEVISTILPFKILTRIKLFELKTLYENIIEHNLKLKM